MSIRSLEHQGFLKKGYVHSQWELRRRVLRYLLKTIGFTLLIKLDRVSGVENVPEKGPAILLINHIAFVDPIVVVHVVPRNIVPMAKIEVYNYPIIGIIPRLWGVIPVRREEADRRAIQQAMDVLNAGEIILVAPEGTRNPCLQRGKVGAAYLASRCGVPIVPVAIEGTIGFPALPISPRWKQPGVSIQFGRAFRFRSELAHAGREQLRLMTDEAMYILASMLPEHRRGYYSNIENATTKTIEFL